MSVEQMISGTKFCTHHSIDISLLHSLNDYGLIKIITEEHDCFLEPEQLGAIEKIIHLHTDLQINLEGIDAILHLLQRVEVVQAEITTLKNKLRLYENNH